MSSDLGKANNLLEALRASDRLLLEPYLSEVKVQSEEVLYEPGDEVRKVFFPAGATLLAFRVVMEDGRAIETALVGREGAVAGIVSRGFVPAYCRAEVQFGGPAYTMNLAQLEEAKNRSPTLHQLFARYADCLMAQIFQSVACNATHSIEQRAAKWLVSAMERTGESQFSLTQDQLAGMLGVGRSYASRIIQRFKSLGLVSTSRGRLVVDNLRGLEEQSCPCQRAVKRHFEELLAGVYPKPTSARVQRGRTG